MKLERVLNPAMQGSKFTKLNDCKNSIFLAGPCPRDGSKDKWREEAIAILNKLGFTGTVLNPTNPNYDVNDPNYYVKQVEWEIEAMYKASAIVFWVERSEEHPAFTTNIEFGQWFDKPRVYCGWSNKAINNSYLDERLRLIGKRRYSSLGALLSKVVIDLQSPGKKYFISDTHFSQERTLTLSKRPFRDIKDMDYNIISNWNKTVTMNDDVYFLGDFGETFDYINLLNFKTLHFVLGNYERIDSKTNKDISNKTEDKLNTFDGVKVYRRGDCKIKLRDGREILCIHEPLDPENKTNYTAKLCAYGHIHGRTVYKLNGADVGVDINNFSPVEEDTLIWKLNAIKYLDQNVWNMNCV